MYLKDGIQMPVVKKESDILRKVQQEIRYYMLNGLYAGNKVQKSVE